MARRRALLLLLLLAAPALASPPSLQPVTVEARPESLCLRDATIVEAVLGKDADSKSLRAHIGTLGAPAPKSSSTHAELVHAFVVAHRVRAAVGGKLAGGGVEPLRSALRDRGCTFEMGAKTDALYAQLSGRLERECYLVNPERPLVQSLNLEDLRATCDERVLASSGSQKELIDRIYGFQRHCDSLSTAIANFQCTTGHAEDELGRRGLSKLGSKEELFQRLSDVISLGANTTKAAPAVCDVASAGPVCIENGKKVLSADAVPKGLLARFSFDDAAGLDTSGKANHMRADTADKLKFGPGIGGRGNAARFVGGSDFAEVPHHPAYLEAGQTFTLEMWVFLRQDSTGDWRVLFQKGRNDGERTPALFLEPLTRGVEFFVSTDDASQPAGERIWSNSFIPLHRWTHVAAVAEGHTLRMYINGLLDCENQTVGSITHNVGPMYVGGHPWRPIGGVDSYIDEVQYHGRALSTDEIQAKASFALGGVEPSFVELGCMGCALHAAQASCRSGYHLCNVRDLFSGGYMLARAMGWATGSSHVWSAEEYAAGGSVNASWGGVGPTAGAGLGLCCLDND